MGIKKIGQNFLIDKSVAEREIKYAMINKNDTVLEIGPGNGILTKIIADKAKHVIAVEIDKKLVENLKKIIPKNVTLITADILELDLFKIIPFNKVVANLPFQISSPITFKLLDYPFSKAVLIYQKEFAERLVAKHDSKNYSRLSVGVHYKSNCKILETVPKNCFNPIPKVDSCVVEIIPRKKPPFDLLNEDYFYLILKLLFNQRRKKIRNILKINNSEFKNIPYLNNRVEQLSPIQIGELCNFLYKINFKS